MQGKERGFTLIELIVALTVAAILSLMTHHIATETLPRYQVHAATNLLLGLIQEARAGAMTEGNRFICDSNHGCGKFEETRKLLLGHDQNGDGELQDQEVIQQYRLPGNTRLIWRRFQGNALVFHGSGNAHFQNGSFYICNDVSARRIVMNWIGRTRVEKANTDNCNQP
jgi:type IV fimbrial biogenesis protein FimT